jgi:hypothetical protein
MCHRYRAPPFYFRPQNRFPPQLKAAIAIASFSRRDLGIDCISQCIVSRGAITRHAKPRPRGSGQRITNSGVHLLPRIWQFLTTLQADLIRSWMDREHVAESTVMTPTKNLGQPKRQPHNSGRCRRSQLPWASSQPSRDLTLVRASAIAQSAAP